jgi:hypothetical protein
VTESGPGPIDDGFGSILATRQKREVDGSARQEGQLTLHRSPALDHGGPRPIVAIGPLSLYANGFAVSPATARAMFSPAHFPDWSATEPSWGKALSVSAW